MFKLNWNKGSWIDFTFNTTLAIVVTYFFEKYLFLSKWCFASVILSSEKIPDTFTTIGLLLLNITWICSRRWKNGYLHVDITGTVFSLMTVLHGCFVYYYVLCKIQRNWFRKLSLNLQNILTKLFQNLYNSYDFVQLRLNLYRPFKKKLQLPIKGWKEYHLNGARISKAKQP